jgi:hypothetical protein
MKRTISHGLAYLALATCLVACERGARDVEGTDRDAAVPAASQTAEPSGGGADAPAPSLPPPTTATDPAAPPRRPFRRCPSRAPRTPFRACQPRRQASGPSAASW